MAARFLRAIAHTDAARWDALAGTQPLLRHGFLNALEGHGCIRADYGWSPYHLLLEDQDQLLGAAPCYIKGNSHGEFVFDWSWAQAFADAGLDYYPKLLLGVPYTPVCGPRLLAATQTGKLALIDALLDVLERSNVSSLHANFLLEADRVAFAQAGFIERCQVQFHLHLNGALSFDQFLARFSSKKRKNIRQERAKVAANGFTFRTLSGAEIGPEDLALAHRFYLNTFDQKANHAALTLDFFTAVKADLVLVQAQHGDRPVAGAICFRDEHTLYGRYWGTEAGLEQRLDCTGLHFETCYYQGIEYLIQNGLTRFEPGAQGEHKQARGFEPVLTWSAHWIKDRRFREPIAQFCRRERAQVELYLDELKTHSPYRQAT